MATFGDGDGSRGGSGGISPWRNNGPSYGPPGAPDGNQPGASSSSTNTSNKKERDRDKTHETVCNMLSMLTMGVDEQSSNNYSQEKSSKRHNCYSPSADNQRMLLLSLATTPESCLTLRRAGCIPLLVELIHPPQRMEGMQPPEIIQVRAARALKNIVQFNPDEKEKKKELRVLRLLEGIRLFSEAVKGLLKKRESDPQDQGGEEGDTAERSSTEYLQHPTTSLGALTKLSFDEEHRYTMCLLGAIHALADLIVSDHLIHGNDPPNLKEDCLVLRRLTGMALTNLTVNDKTNKALLCGMKEFLMCLLNQLDCDNEEICQISASVLRNLSCRADSASRQSLSEVSACSKLMLAAMKAQRESTLKANLGAIWNLSAQCPKNMADTSSASADALPFLISLMRPNNPIVKQMKAPMTIIEHASSILRNISQHLRVSPELKKVLRENHCYEILLDHLKSSSMLVVGNACGTLCSLSGGPDSEEDQRKLLDLNAIPMLKSLVYSKDQRICQGSSTALRNLLSSKFAKEYTLDSRLSAQIYTTSSVASNYSGHQTHQQQKSPNSDSDHETETRSTSSNGYNSQLRVNQPEPPAAHQSSVAASLFQQQRGGHKPKMVQFHEHPALALSLSTQPLGYHNNRPATINYQSDSEPLDLTMTSAKSSPIHVISHAEFAGMGSNSYHHRLQRGSSASTTGIPQPQRQSYRFYETNSPLHQHRSDTEPVQQFGYSGVKFNQSCPEILSRFQQNMTPAHQVIHDSLPLDFSSTSGSTSSSIRGGEASASRSLLNDSNGGGGDTTFNYSLQYHEGDGDEETAHRESTNTKSDDTVKTYCYEGTPQNFSKSNSCQDLVQELEYERESATQCNATNTDSSNVKNSVAVNKLQPIDEVKPYYVENTPAAFSRASSLSSIDSEGVMNSGDPTFTEAPVDNDFPGKHSPALIAIQTPPQPLPRKRNSQSHTPSRVTFSAEETPLMFSRCSSVASLDSLDVGTAEGGGGSGPAHRSNEDDLSDYSRRASEVVSPSDLPDSPRALAPPVRMFEPTAKARTLIDKKPTVDEDAVRVYSISMEEKSGMQSCRSLSPLTVDGEELPIIGKNKLDPPKEGTSTDGTGSTVIEIIVPVSENNEQDNPPKPPNYDEMKIFAMEGTPFYGVSNATSLSDLMADIDEDHVEEKQTNPIQNGTTSTANQIENKIEPPIEVKQIEEPIYSDAQLLDKCIRVGKALGIPKSQSEFRLGNTKEGNKGDNSNGKGGKGLQKITSKSQDFEVYDPDLEALIQMGRNRPKENNKSSGRGKSSKKGDKIRATHSSTTRIKSPIPPTNLPIAEIEEKKPEVKPSPIQPSLSNTLSNDKKSIEESSEENPDSHSNADTIDFGGNGNVLDPNQISCTSLGSEWDDETKTFSSPIPSMSMSTAFKLAGSVVGELSTSLEKSSLPQKIELEKVNMNESINISCMSVSVQHELLENVDPPSTFSNLISSTDCIGPQSPQLQPRSQNSTLSDKLNKKWKALNAAADNSTQSNLSGQKPPMEFDMDSSMISVASIKSEIYELSTTDSMQNEIFESAVEEVEEKIIVIRQSAAGDDTYTIFPSENANRLSGVKSTDLSDGGNTVVSEDFTDAEDIEEFETAPLDDKSEEIASKPEKADVEKKIGETNENDACKKKNDVLPPPQTSQNAKPLMQVHPLSNESNKYNTFVVKKSPMSPRASPKQMRRDDPERYRTRTINPLNVGKGVVDANGNPDVKFQTFRVGGPKVVKPISNNVNIDSDSTNSGASTPSHSPKGVRGRRRPLYQSLPPSAIIRKQKTAPPPIPPKPVRTSSSPARSTASTGTGGGVYVRPTRTTELRIAANNSREISPKRAESANSRNSSNSSLNLIHPSSRMSDIGIPARPKVAPKPPTRTTPSMTPSVTPTPRGFTGSSCNVPIQIKASNSSFGFGQQAKIGDVGGNSNMKGYSTLPKSSKLGMETPFSADRYSVGQSKESIPESEKSGKSGKGKISNLWRKMDFRVHKEQSITDKTQKDSEKKSTSSKISNFFGRNKKQDKEKTPPTVPPPTTTAPKPFREPLPIHSDSAGNNFALNCAPASTGEFRVRRDGESNKVIVPPFNYTPPDRSSVLNNGKESNESNPSTTDSHTTPSGRSSKITTV